MPLELRLAWRNVWRNPRRTALTVAATVFAVVLVVFFVAMAAGLHEKMKLFDQMALWVYVAAFVAMAFGIANVLLMAVYERIREIGIMLAVGMKGGRLVLMIVVESLFVTLLGLALGFAGAVAGVWALQDGIDLSFFAEGLSAFGVGTRLVPVLRWADFTVPMAVALATALVASAWPALHAVRFRPAEAVRRV